MRDVIKIQIIGYLGIHKFGVPEEMAKLIDEDLNLIEDLCFELCHQGVLEHKLSKYFLADVDDPKERDEA